MLKYDSGLMCHLILSIDIVVSVYQCMYCIQYIEYSVQCLSMTDDMIWYWYGTGTGTGTGMVWYGMVYVQVMTWYGMVWYGMVWLYLVSYMVLVLYSWYGYGMRMVWYGMVWYGHDSTWQYSTVQYLSSGTGMVWCMVWVWYGMTVHGTWYWYSWSWYWYRYWYSYMYCTVWHVQYSTVLMSSVLYSTVQYSTVCHTYSTFMTYCTYIHTVWQTTVQYSTYSTCQ